MRTYDILKTQQDLRRLSWTCAIFTSEIPKSSTPSRNLSREPSVVVEGTAAATTGDRLACREGTGRYETHYALSSYSEQRGIYGRECIAELIAARIAHALGIAAVRPRLVHALVQVGGTDFDTWLSVSKPFRRPGERGTSLQSFFELHRTDGETIAVFSARYGWLSDIGGLLLLDDVTGNRSRTAADIDVLADGSGNVRLSPAHTFGGATFGGVFDDAGTKGDSPAGAAKGRKAAYLMDDPTLQDAMHAARATYDDAVLETNREAILAGMTDGILTETECDAIWAFVQGRWCA